MATDLTAHQTRGAAPIRWIYDPDKADEREAFKRSLSGGGGSSARPSWIDSPPEGYVVASSDSGLLRSTARTMAADRLRQLGAASGSQYWTDPDTGQTFAMGKKRPAAEAAPERPQEPVADAPLALDDYEQPTLDPVDLDLELGEEEEEEEELAIEPAIREPALDYALDEEDEEEALSLEDQIVETTRFRESPDISIAGSTPAVNPMEQFRDVYGFGFEDATAPRFPVSPDISITGSTPAPDATQLMRRSAEAGGAATPPATTAVDISAAGGVPALMNEEDRERRFAEIQGDRIEEAPQFDVGRDISITGSGDMAKLPEDAGPGLLDRLAGMGGKIGQLVRDNPDLVLQGLRTIGELGGEYKRGRREQEAADRMAQEARMGTAISALTRGRVNPTVAPRMPRTSAGEGMFDVLAGIGRGGQEFMGQKRALEEQERLEGIEDETLSAERAEKDRRFGLDKYRAETERMAVAGKDEAPTKEEAAEIEAKKVDDAQMIMAHVSGLLETFDEGGPFTTGAVASFTGERNYDPFGDAPRIQQEYESQKIVLFEFIKELGKLGRLSDKDVELIERTLPDKFTGKQRLQGAYNGIAKVLNRSTRGAFEAGPSPFEEGYDPERNMRLLRRGQATSPQAASISEEEIEELVERAEDDDPEAIAELQRLGFF